jgi:adenylate cyclase
MADERTDRQRSAANGLAMRYAAGLTFAQLITAAEVVAVVISLSSQTSGVTRSLLTQTNLVIATGLVMAAVIVTAVGAHWIVRPSLQWFVTGAEPDARQRHDAINMVRRQTVLLFVTWAFTGAVVIIANLRGGWSTATMIVVAVLFGGTASISTSLLLAQRIYRPIVAAANKDFTSRETAPGVVARLVLMWVANSALPSIAIALLVVAHSFGWFVQKTASVVTPVVVITVVSIALGMRALILVARSISDPINDVVDAMAEVERGELGQQVDVYEQSEIGRLQHGFNRMVIGLSERDRLRELFGRHVGPDVARLAVEADDSQTTQAREVAVLFIDLADSTRLAATRAPGEVADVLNAFFRIVVAAVDERHGFVNKFQGDAALAVFGAPIQADDAATAALATARTLSANLKSLPEVDFGIGVSAGLVFAGNIGAENRYEYTVIGDPVNEAARLADTAKTVPGRTVASGAAIERAESTERQRWTVNGTVLLRGRSEATRTHTPCRENGVHER